MKTPSAWNKGIRKLDISRDCIEHLFEKLEACVLVFLTIGECIYGDIVVRFIESEVGVCSCIGADYKWPALFSSTRKIFENYSIVEAIFGSIERVISVLTVSSLVGSVSRE